MAASLLKGFLRKRQLTMLLIAPKGKWDGNGF